jgi:outer membrane immunogenic protein
MKLKIGFLLGSTALYLLPVVALAADLPARTKAPAPLMAAANHDWSGLYAGLQGGGQRFTNKSSYGTSSANSAFGGVHAGYNLQYNSLVLGVEGDLEFGAKGNVRASSGENGFEWNNGMFQASVRARLGFAIDKVLIYSTAGVAFAGSKTAYSGASVEKDTMTGWTVGGGVEVALSKAWSARIEYRYTDFGKYTHTSVSPSIEHNVTSQAVRVGVSYHY